MKRLIILSAWLWLWTPAYCDTCTQVGSVMRCQDGTQIQDLGNGVIDYKNPIKEQVDTQNDTTEQINENWKLLREMNKENEEADE